MGDKIRVVYGLNVISEAYNNLHRESDALEASLRALNISKELKNDPLISQCYDFLAMTHSAIGNKSEELKNLKQSKKISENGNNKDMLGRTLAMIATHFQQTGDLDSSMHYIKESFKIHNELGNKSQVLQNISFMAGLDLQKGDTESAMDHLDQSMVIANEIKDDMRYHFYHFGKGLIYFQQKDYAQAMDGNMSKWYEWYTGNEKDLLKDGLLLNETIVKILRDMSIYLVCFKKLGRDVNLSQLEILMEETPERKYGYELNYRLYQLYDDRSYLKSSYEKIMDLKSKLDKKTGGKFINYPLESEIIEAYQSIS